MSQIKGKNTKPEILVRKFLFSNGFRFRLHDKKLPGKPDIILPKYKTAIFVHGCFWHGHENCKYFKIPKTRADWWLIKINGNIVNDKKKQLLLQEMGWKVLYVWECDLKTGLVDKTLDKLVHDIEN